VRLLTHDALASFVAADSAVTNTRMLRCAKVTTQRSVSAGRLPVAARVL
jgi:hypothetical protein